MPSADHEAHIQLAHDLEFTRYLLDRFRVFDKLGVPAPPLAASDPYPARVTKLVPVSYEADGMRILKDAQGRPQLALVHETQLEFRRDKLWKWPLYASHLRAELDGVPVVIVVYCPDPGVARQYREALATDLGSVRTDPVIYTPDDIPLVTDLGEALRNPTAAFVAAVIRCNDPAVTDVFPVLTEVIMRVGDKGLRYYDAMRSVLPPAARAIWEGSMTTVMGYEYQTDFLRDAKAEGLAEGLAEGAVKARADTVLMLLENRITKVPQWAHKMIVSCTDIDQLNDWILRAATATTIEDVIPKKR